MGTPREDLSFVFKTEADSIFIYYLTGTLSLVFFITLLITRSLQRKQPMVTELIHDSNCAEDLVTYLVSVQTSIWPGSGCPSGVKVYMQLIGVNKLSQYFLLQSSGSSKPLLQRGFTDVFMVKVPVSVGPISSVDMILSGLQGLLKWRIRKVEIQQITSSKAQQIPVCVIVTERCEQTTYHTVNIVHSGRGCVEKLLMYHQWLAQFGNTIRYGAFTAVTHVICVFTTLTFLLDLTLVTYILLPSGEYEGQFELNYRSVLIGTLSPAFGYSCFLFAVEMLLRKVKSKVKKPGNAYYTLQQESKKLTVKYDASMTSIVTKEPNMISGTKERILFNEEVFKTPLIWDNKFQNMTVFLKRLLSQVDTISDLHYFKSIPTFEDEYFSAYDLSSYITLHIPQYSGIALNHLLGDSSQVHIKGSSLLDLIHKGESYHSVRSAFSSKSVEATESKSSDIIVDISNDLGAMRMSDISLTRDNPSVISSVCSVDGTLFWSQYKQYRQNNKYNKSELEEENDLNDNARKEGDKQKKQQSKSVDHSEDLVKKPEDAIESDKKLAGTSDSDERLDDADGSEKGPIETAESDKRQSEIFGSNRRLTETLGSNKRLDETSVSTRGSIPAEDLDVVINFTDVDQDFDVKLEMIESEPQSEEKSSVPKDEEEKELHHRLDDSMDSVKLGMFLDRESNLKSRSRKLVADICKFYRKIRVEMIEGEIIYVLPEILEWFDNVIECIILSCYEKTDLDLEDVFEETNMMTLITYMSGEIILFTIHNVFKALNFGNMDLPDIVVMSHRIMLGVEEITYTVLYIIQNGTLESDQLQIISCLDVHKYLTHLCTEFLKHCFQLIVHANELTWAYFEIYLLQTLRHHLEGNIFQDLMTFIEDNLQYETVETVVLQKLCKSAIEEAKCEVWDEYSDERHIFIDLTVKHEVLDKITAVRNKIYQREKAFNREYNLLAKKKKSRLQKLAEKRQKKRIESKVKVKDFTTRWKLWEEETGRSDIPSYKDLIQYSMHLEKIGKNLTTVQDYLEKKWRRQGLKTEVGVASCLVQSLIFSHVNTEDASLQFENYLQVKRVEQSIKEFLHFMLDDLTGCIVSEAADDYNVTGFPDTLQLKLAAEDICTRTDTMKDLLLQELDTVTEYALAIEDHKLSMDKSLIESTTSLIMKKSSKLLRWAPTVSEMLTDNSPNKPKKSTLDVSQLAKSRMSEKPREESSDLEIPDDVMNGFKVIIDDDTEQLEFSLDTSDQEDKITGDLVTDDNTVDVKKDTVNETEDIADTHESSPDKEDMDLVHVDENMITETESAVEETSIDDLKTELKLMKLFLREYQEKENLRSLCTLMSYVQKQKQQRNRITNTVLNNIIDSYYILEEGDDSHTFTRAGLYQLEYDVTEESQKPLPSFLKTLIVIVLLLGIVFSFVMVTLVGGQFSTIQNQEYICYYLICLVEFALLFEPLRALLIAWFCDKK